MSDLLDLIPQAEVPRPLDSALGILLRRDEGAAPRLLFVLRSRRSRFMPGHLAFPGGRMDAADRPDESGAYARCASREVAEETGIEVSPETWHDLGERITPPMFPRRFRTRFFLAEFPAAARLPAASPAPGEIEELRLAEPATVLEQWERGATLVPPPALPMLRVLAGQPERPLDELAALLLEANRLEQRLPRVEFAPDIWVLPVRTRTIPPATHTNTWLAGGRRFVIIDPGSGREDEIERLLGVVERRRALGHVADSVLLTHHHPDHTSGALAVTRALGLPLRGHQATIDALGVSTEPAEARRLEDGERLDLDGMTLKAMHTPGHAPGHLAFEVVDRGILIAGDLLSGFSTILIHPDEGDMQQYLASLGRVRDGGYRQLLPAHGPPLPGRAAAKVIEHRRQREAQIRDELSPEWRDLAGIARAAYEGAPELPPVLAELQTLAHLLYLERRGLARQHGKMWGSKDSGSDPES